MDYIVFKNTGRKQYRVYVDGMEYEGDLIYKGHKLGVELNLLSALIDFRLEKISGSITVLRYDKVKDDISMLDKNIWKVGNSESFESLIKESWESMQNALESKFGKFRKILITAVNI